MEHEVIFSAFYECLKREYKALVREVVREEIHELLEMTHDVHKRLIRQHQQQSYTIKQTATLMGISESSIRRLIDKRKIIPVFLNGERGKCTILGSSIDEYYQANQSKR